MKPERLTLFMTLTLCLAACAADRSKEVKGAEAELTSAQQEAQREEARLKEKHAREQAKAQQEAAHERARLRAKQLEEHKETQQETAEELGEAREEVAKARAGMQRERATTEADARERLQKAEAHAMEGKNRSAMVPANKRAKFDESVNLYDLKKAELERDIENLKRAPDDKWNEAKKKVENGLDALDRFADRIHDSM